MSNLTLYSDPRLPCPQRVLLTAEELGIELNIIPIDITSNEHKTPEFTALNRFNAIPVLIDYSTTPPFVLRESRAICRYIVLLSDSTLMPKSSDLRSLARFEEAASLEVTGFDPFANRIVLEKYFNPIFGNVTNEEVVKDLQSNLEDKLDKMELLLIERTFMAGDTFTLADIFYVPYMSKLVAIEDVLDKRPNLRAWWARVEGQKSYQKTIGFTS